MSRIRISRRRFVTAGALGTLGALLAPEAVLADDGQPELLRWDLVSITDGVVLPGGTDVGKDANTGDTVSLTGSGDAQPAEARATGGGTFVHRHADGSLDAEGIFFVTGFNSFVNNGGSLVGVPVKDGIGTLRQTTGGFLSVNIRAIVDAPPAIKGAMVDAVLGVHCNLPGGAATITEGITLSVPEFHLNFVQDGGATLFHILDT
jgi:hypothetical protein